MSLINNNKYLNLQKAYESIYSSETMVFEESEKQIDQEISLEKFSDQEIYNMWVEELVRDTINEMVEEGLVLEGMDTSTWLKGTKELGGRLLSKVTGLGKGRLGLKPPKPVPQGYQGPPAPSSTTYGHGRRALTFAALGAAGNELMRGTPLGKEILRRIGAAGQAVVDPSKTEQPSMYR